MDLRVESEIAGPSGLQNRKTVDTTVSKDRDLNSSRRALIDRTAVLYGQTPLGIQKRQLNQMAAEMNTNLETLCAKIVSLSEDQRFLFLKTYYEKLNDNLETFFTNFNDYKTEKPATEEQKAARDASINEKSKMKMKRKNKIRNSYQNVNQSRERFDNSVISDPTNRLMTKKNANDISISDPSTNNTTTHNCSFAKRKRLMQPLNDDGRRSVTRTNAAHLRHEDEEYESVITSILFDDTKSELKKILKKKDKSHISPTKYGTILETLLFE